MNRDERAEFGPRILVERERLGMSRAELEEATGVTLRQISAIERGDSVAQPGTLEKILQALGLSPNANGHIGEEVELLLAVISPFLATLDDEHRAAAMPKLVAALVAEMRAQIAEELSR